MAAAVEAVGREVAVFGSRPSVAVAVGRVGDVVEWERRRDPTFVMTVYGKRFSGRCHSFA